MIATLFAVLTLGAGPVPGYWGELRPGPYQVGFSQSWIVDSTRRLPHGETYGLRYRPILLNVWYPTARLSGARMAYADYFEGAVRSAPFPGLRAYAKALIAYQRATAWRELARVERDSTAPALAARIETFLGSSTFVQRDAPVLKHSGQVVVYTSGSGSSMDDNVVLCEYLASLGYTVVGSAFPAEDNGSFATDASDRSRPRDIARILAELPRRQIAVRHVTAIGHSAGAQALLAFAADPSLPLDAILSLDTTQDYAMLSDRTWSYFTDELIRGRRGVRIPILFAADPSALFELADSLVGTPRFLLTIPELDHNDFISQGNISRWLRQDGDTAADGRIAANYRSLVEFIPRWITATSLAAGSPAPSGPLRLVSLPAGQGAPTVGDDPIQSARELRHLFATADPAVFATRALRARSADPTIADNQVLMMLMVDAIRRGTPERARAAYRALLAGDSTYRSIPDRMERRAKLFESFGAKDIAADWRALRQALSE